MLNSVSRLSPLLILMTGCEKCKQEVDHYPGTCLLKYIKYINSGFNILGQPSDTYLCSLELFVLALYSSSCRGLAPFTRDHSLKKKSNGYMILMENPIFFRLHRLQGIPGGMNLFFSPSRFI